MMPPDDAPSSAVEEEEAEDPPPNLDLYPLKNELNELMNLVIYT